MNNIENLIKQPKCLADFSEYKNEVNERNADNNIAGLRKIFNLDGVARTTTNEKDQNIGRINSTTNHESDEATGGEASTLSDNIPSLYINNTGVSSRITISEADHIGISSIPVPCTDDTNLINRNRYFIQDTKTHTSFENSNGGAQGNHSNTARSIGDISPKNPQNQIFSDNNFNRISKPMHQKF